MYRARVEAVDGLKVRAGGKWLTCIGNRVVRAGDIVWTDGRCVYGHDREPQTPLVIVNPEPKEAIPIQIGFSLYTFRKDKLELVGEMPRGRILNNKKRNVYCSSADAANCTGGGDIYTLEATSAYYNYRPYDEKPLAVPNLNVSITKNGHVLKQVSLSELVKEAISQTLPEAESIPHANGIPDNYNPIKADGWRLYDGIFETFYDQTVNGKVIYSFIEDEKSWAFIYFVHASADKNRVYSANSEAGSWGEPPYAPLYSTSDGFNVQLNVYYFDSGGKHTLIYQHHILVRYKDGIYYQVDPIVTHSEDYSGMDNLKFPLQDNYYFKASISIPWWNDSDDELSTRAKIVYPIVNYAVYSPRDKLLFNYEEPLGANFTIVSLPDKYLVGIKSSNTERGTTENKGGLYLCSEGQLSPLTDTGFEFNCWNYRLRPMKKYKHWWERIQTIE